VIDLLIVANLTYTRDTSAAFVVDLRRGRLSSDYYLRENKLKKVLATTCAVHGQELASSSVKKTMDNTRIEGG
jgi:hypothetical protein